GTLLPKFSKLLRSYEQIYLHKQCYLINTNVFFSFFNRLGLESTNLIEDYRNRINSKFLNNQRIPPNEEFSFAESGPNSNGFSEATSGSGSSTDGTEAFHGMKRTTFSIFL